MSEKRRAEEKLRQKQEAERVAFFEQREQDWWKEINEGIFQSADDGKGYLDWYPPYQTGSFTRCLLEALAKRLEIEVPGIKVSIRTYNNPNTELPSHPYYSLWIAW